MRYINCLKFSNYEFSLLEKRLVFNEPEKPDQSSEAQRDLDSKHDMQVMDELFANKWLSPDQRQKIVDEIDGHPTKVRDDLDQVKRTCLAIDKNKQNGRVATEKLEEWSKAIYGDYQFLKKQNLNIAGNLEDVTGCYSIMDEMKKNKWIDDKEINRVQELLSQNPLKGTETYFDLESKLKEQRRLAQEKESQDADKKLNDDLKK